MNRAWNASKTVAMGMVLAASCQRPSVARQAAVRPVQGQVACDRLSPRGSLVTHPYNGYAEEEGLVAATLFSRARELMSNDIVTSETLIMVMVKSDPRVPIEAVYLMEGPRNPERKRYFRVVHERAKRVITYGVQVPGSYVTEAVIDEQTVKAIERAWGGMARGARWPQGEETRRLPKWMGTEYTFDSVGDEGYGQGLTESPDPGTCAADLVRLGVLLIQLADEPNKENRRAIRTELQRRSRALLDRLEAWE